jgi:UDP-N-acetyl-D-mannosaminuronate dehydrogenase
MKVGISGLGYVGLPLAVAFAEAGHEVVGLDTDARVANRIRVGESTVEDVPSERLTAVAERLLPTTDHAELGACDAVLVCVPTPLANHREPDLTYLVDAATSLSSVLGEGQLVVLESTTYPGTTRERLKPILEESGPAAGRDFHPQFCVRKIERTLNEVSKPVKGSRILLLGVAYKAGVADVRESPALKIIRNLRELGAEIAYHDPHVAEIPELGIRSADLDEELPHADLACVITPHPEVDYRRVVEGSDLVLDFRGVTRGIEAANLVRL